MCAERAVGLTRVPVTGAPTGTERVAEVAVDGFVVWTKETGRPWSQVEVAVCPVNHSRPGAEAAGRLLREAGIDALAAMSDQLALGALGAAHQVGAMVPQELAVTGWDDTEAAGPAGLTTLRQDLREQGARCARIALGRPRPVDQADPPSWGVVRRGSAPRPATR